MSIITIIWHTDKTFSAIWRQYTRTSSKLHHKQQSYRFLYLQTNNGHLIPPAAVTASFCSQQRSGNNTKRSCNRFCAEKVIPFCYQPSHSYNSPLWNVVYLNLRKTLGNTRSKGPGVCWHRRGLPFWANRKPGPLPFPHFYITLLTFRTHLVILIVFLYCIKLTFAQFKAIPDLVIGDTKDSKSFTRIGSTSC